MCKTSKFYTFVWHVKDALKIVLVTTPVVVAFGDNIGYFAKVDGSSMMPTLNPDHKTRDWVFVARWPVRRYDQIELGSIVTAINPRNSHGSRIIKRVAALGGDKIKSSSKYGNVVIPQGHCWLEGDNSRLSFDSKSFGPISTGLITGQALYIIWPPRRWRDLRNNSIERIAYEL